MSNDGLDSWITTALGLPAAVPEEDWRINWRDALFRRSGSPEKCSVRAILMEQNNLGRDRWPDWAPAPQWSPRRVAGSGRRVIL